MLVRCGTFPVVLRNEAGAGLVDTTLGVVIVVTEAVKLAALVVRAATLCIVFTAALLRVVAARTVVRGVDIDEAFGRGADGKRRGTGACRMRRAGRSENIRSALK